MSVFLEPDHRPTFIEGVRAIDPAAGIDRICNIVVDESGIHLDAPRPAGARFIDGTGLWATPGLVDIQVHFREPGFEHKETIASGSRAALAGGITSVVVMPNTRPTLDTPEAVRNQTELSNACDGIQILVAAAATHGISGKTLTDYAALKEAGAVAVTDDGFPLAGDDEMRKSLELCAANDLLFMQHAEDPTLSQHGVMTLGPTSEKLGFPGQHADAEGVMVERDVELARQAGARYHVLHMSTKRSLEAVKRARQAGAKVTCEASPHHLLLTDENCIGANGEADTNFKMNPPLRSESDRQALIEGLKDGSIDAVATDHAPHATSEKAQGFLKGPFGVIGLETAFAALLTFVHDGTISDVRAVELMTAGPRRILKRTDLGSFEGAPNLTLINPHRSWTVGENDLVGMQKNSSFLGRTFKGRVVATFLRGNLRYASDLEV